MKQLQIRRNCGKVPTGTPAMFSSIDLPSTCARRTCTKLHPFPGGQGWSWTIVSNHREVRTERRWSKLWQNICQCCMYCLQPPLREHFRAHRLVRIIFMTISWKIIYPAITAWCCEFWWFVCVLWTVRLGAKFGGCAATCVVKSLNSGPKASD